MRGVSMSQEQAYKSALKGKTAVSPYTPWLKSVTSVTNEPFKV